MLTSVTEEGKRRQVEEITHIVVSAADTMN